MFEVRRTAAFSAWLDSLSDRLGRAAVLTRLARLTLGNPGDARPVGSGVSELRIDVGPGYRVYYLRAGQAVYLVLGGGDKSTQVADIRRAVEMAEALRAIERAKKPARKPK